MIFMIVRTLIGPNPGVFNTSHRGAKAGSPLQKGEIFFRGAAHRNATARALSRQWHFSACCASAHSFCASDWLGGV